MSCNFVFLKNPVKNFTKIIGIIFLGIFIFPIVIFSATTTDSLLPGDFCFNKNLHPYTFDPDVKYLQIFLNENGFFATVKGLENNNYNIDTVLAVILFQEHYANDLLMPVGLTAGTGNFGNITRKKVNDILGCNTIFEIATTTSKESKITQEVSTTTIPEIIINTGNQIPVTQQQNSIIPDALEIGTTTKIVSEVNIKLVEKKEATTTPKTSYATKPEVTYLSVVSNIKIVRSLINNISQGYNNVLFFIKNTFEKLMILLGFA